MWSRVVYVIFFKKKAKAARAFIGALFAFYSVVKLSFCPLQHNTYHPVLTVKSSFSWDLISMTFYFF
jgi:hypothetical protein